MTVLAPQGLRLVCPRCRGALAERSDALRCASCSEEYPVVAGIPDLRLTPDPWISLEDDRAKALRLESMTRGLHFEDAVRAYWEITPGTPPALAARFTEHVLGAEPRSREWLAKLPVRGDDGPWLDLGCGTADLAAAAGDVRVIGVDVALRWLVIARQRPGLGPEDTLVCCNAEHLPFPDGSFSRVLSLGMLEHCADERPVLREAARVLRTGGDFHARTTNRYSLLREPHVQVWGVGWVPRRWADAYVRLVARSRYLYHRPLSSRELRTGLRAAGFRDVRCAPARLLASDRARLGARGLRAADLYSRFAGRRLAGAVLSWVVPLLEIRGIRR